MRWLAFPWMVLAALLTLAPTPPSHAAIPVPKGFQLLKSYLGAALYSRKVGARTDYVQVVALGMGGTVNLMTGSVTDPGKGLGVYGGDNPAYLRRSLGGFCSNRSESTRDYPLMTGSALRGRHRPRRYYGLC